MVLPKRLNQRRVAGLAEASLMVALLTCGYPSTSRASVTEEQGAAIGHTALQCWPAEEHIVLSADIQPPGDVQKTLLYFRWDRHAAWYFVPMMLNTQGVWVAVMPKTLPGTTGAVYYFESLSSSYISTRSAEYRVPVKPASNCENPGAVVYTGTNPNITVGAARAGQPVPPGFDVSGIGAYINPTGITSGASTGGGIGGKTLAIIGGAGAAGAAVALSGGGGGDATTTTDGIAGITTTAGLSTTSVSGAGPSSTSTTTPGGGPSTTTSPGTSTTTPPGGSSTTLPGSSTTLPGSSTTLPGSSTTLPGSSTTLPGSSTTTLPGSSTTTLPGSSTTTLPGTSTTTLPASSTTTTAATTSVPTTTVATTSAATTSAATTSAATTSAATTSASSATLSVSKTASANPVNVGNNLTYTVRVTNTGGSTANSVTVDDAVPGSMLILGSSANCSVIVQRVICAMLSITPGQTKSINITVRPMVAGNFANRATATSANAPQASGQTNTQVN